MSRIAAVVLAAGFSRRLGVAKQFVDLCGKPALQHVLDALRHTGFEPLILVVNPEVTRALAGLDTTGYRVVVNEQAAEGQSSSVRAAIAALPPDSDAVVFVLGDQPFVDRSTIERLIELFERTGAPIVRPRYADGPGNPVLIARPLFEELAALTGDTGARPLFQRHADELVECDCTDRSAPLDLDTPEDVERARRICRERQVQR
ncbi:MAG: nucleotidyltransferase family protein [Thermomicrobium sp.]|nr:nucleotidyltransferase family protein [Thermomicrobium sp.]